MKKQKRIFEVVMSMLPSTGNQLIYKDLLYLNDNFQSDYGAPNAPKGYQDVPVKLMFTMVVFCIKGRLQVRLNLKEYAVGANDLLVITPGTILDKMEAAEGTQTGVIAAAYSDFHKMPNNSLDLQLRQEILTQPNVVHLSDRHMDRFVECYHMLRDTISDTTMTYHEEALNGYMQVMEAYWVNELMANRREAPTKRITRNEEIFYRFLSDVQRHYFEQRTVAFYADKACLSPKYLGQVVTKVSGRHPLDWIRDYIILDAKAMILSNEYSILQISEALGFPNSSFFGKYFKEAVGCSPGQFRNKKFSLKDNGKNTSES
ncbi:MAG: helix-turn-helix domain-containing protein [Prevotella sp.]|nr:helix-turn-helix domain-containing protein [Prevotella sp.]